MGGLFKLDSLQTETQHLSSAGSVALRTAGYPSPGPPKFMALEVIKLALRLCEVDKLVDEHTQTDILPRTR